MLGFLDPLYWLFLLPALAAAGLATFVTRSTFHRYSKVSSETGITGKEAARRLLDHHGLENVKIEIVRGFLSDHYDPRSRTLRLSPAVGTGTSLSGIGVACHEAGHALQHARRYAPLAARSALVPITQFGSQGSYLFFMLGLLLGPAGQILIRLAILLFASVVIFSLITLPVEWNATTRAKRLMVSAGIVTPEERDQAAAVLNAAFLTYLASAFTAVMTLIYFLVRAGVLGGGDE